MKCVKEGEEEGVKGWNNRGFISVYRLLFAQSLFLEATEKRNKTGLSAPQPCQTGRSLTPHNHPQSGPHILPLLWFTVCSILLSSRQFLFSATCFCILKRPLNQQGERLLVCKRTCLKNHFTDFLSLVHSSLN